ncbi:unnamed protein product, partial [Prunus brigantina]
VNTRISVTEKVQNEADDGKAFFSDGVFYHVLSPQLKGSLVADSVQNGQFNFTFESKLGSKKSRREQEEGEEKAKQTICLTVLAHVSPQDPKANLWPQHKTHAVQA